MLVTCREAAVLLGVTRDQARWILHAGLAGPAERTVGSILHGAELVGRLAARRPPSVELVRACPPTARGVLVTRVLHRGLDVRRPLVDQLGAVRGPWPVSVWERIRIRTLIAEQGFIPFVATVCGFVAVGANITGVTARHPEGRITGDGENWRGIPGADLDLAPPGPWFDLFRDTRMPGGRGAHWRLWRPD